MLEGKEVKDLIIDKRVVLPESFTDIVTSEMTATCFMLEPKVYNKDSTNRYAAKDKMGLYVYILL